MPAAWVDAWRASPSSDDGVVEKFFHLFIGLIEFADLRFFVDGLFDIPFSSGCNQLGDLVHFRIRHTQCAADITTAALDFMVPKVMIWATLSFPYFSVTYRMTSSLPLLAEIDIDIGHADTFGIQEPLKDQIVFDGINIGDPQAIGYKAAGSRASSRSDGYTVRFCIVDKIGDDEKITGKTRFLDDVQFVIEVCPRILGQVLRRIRRIDG